MFMYKMKKIFAMAASGVMASVLFVGCGAGSDKPRNINFKTAYNSAYDKVSQSGLKKPYIDYEISVFNYCCTLANDGSYISIDVPFEAESLSDAYSDAYHYVESKEVLFDSHINKTLITIDKINNSLGLPDDIQDDMVDILYNDKPANYQQTIEEVGVKIEWEYSENEYFRVMYTKA